MNQLFKNSLYHPDNKDILDFLEAKEVSYGSLSRYLKTRRIYISSDNNIEQTREYVSLLPFDWKQTCDLISLINLPPIRQKETKSSMESTCQISEIIEASQEVDIIRSPKQREVYSIRKNASDVIEVDVKYIESDASQTRLFQKKEKSLSIRIEKKDNVLHFRHDANPRASSIVQYIQGQILELSKENEKPKIWSINLENIKTPESRVKFFMGMMTNIKSMTLRNITEIKVERLTPDDSQLEEDHEEPDTDELEESIKKLIFKGNNLNTTTEYKNIISRGFFISYAKWQSETSNNNSIYVEFEAGFKDANKGDGFQYSTLGKYDRDSDGVLTKKRVKLSDLEASNYTSLLEDSAEDSLKNI